jgi:hypothetical protein
VLSCDPHATLDLTFVFLPAGEPWVRRGVDAASLPPVGDMPASRWLVFNRSVRAKAPPVNTPAFWTIVDANCAPEDGELGNRSVTDL